MRFLVTALVVMWLMLASGEQALAGVHPLALPTTVHPTAGIRLQAKMAERWRHALLPSTAITDTVAMLRAQPATWTEPFIQERGHWSTASNNAIARFYRDQAYHMVVRAADELAWSTADLTLADFLVEVDVTRAAGPRDANAGLLFRYQDARNFYLFSINGAGAFQLYKMVAGHWEALRTWTASAALETGPGAANRLGVLAQDRQLTLLANGQVLAQIEDGTFDAGDVALAAGTYTGPGIAVVFDDLAVWDLAVTQPGAASESTPPTRPQGVAPQAATPAVAPCQVQVRGRYLHVFDGTWDMCTQTIQASEAAADFRYGAWGTLSLAVNRMGQIYTLDANGQWQMAGLILNQDGSSGSLWDRCLAGNIEACNQLRRNYGSAIDAWDRLFPENWFDAAK